mmetsp:Transcript_96063/g.260814  ORF Transcript_96063/g.260814 Transcript_96063/m.260814 type:complete len:294 (-) Transcript_96063:8-889(-)
MARRPLNAGHFERPQISTSVPAGKSSGEAEASGSAGRSTSTSTTGPVSSTAGGRDGDCSTSSATLSLSASAHSRCRNIPCGIDCTCLSSPREPSKSKCMKVLRTAATPSGVSRPGGLPMPPRGLVPGEPVVEADVEHSVTAVSQCWSAPTGCGVPALPPAPCGESGSSFGGEVAAAAGGAPAALAGAPSEALKRWSWRSCPRPKLSHRSPGCRSTSFLVCFLWPVVIWGSPSVVRESSAKNSRMMDSRSSSPASSAAPRATDSTRGAMRPSGLRSGCAGAACPPPADELLHAA